MMRNRERQRRYRKKGERNEKKKSVKRSNGG